MQVEEAEGSLRVFGVGSQRTFVVGDPDFIKAIDPIARDGAPDFSNPRQALQDAGAVGPPQEGQAGVIFGTLFIVAVIWWIAIASSGGFWTVVLYLVAIFFTIGLISMICCLGGRNESDHSSRSEVDSRASTRPRHACRTTQQGDAVENLP